MIYRPILAPILTVVLPLVVAANNMSEPVTRIATFRFHPSVTAAQKSDRARSFLDLYAQYPELILEGPNGGRPLDTPLKLTGVKRDALWDLGFVVVFKVCLWQRR
jgi:hypothetical protein